MPTKYILKPDGTAIQSDGISVNDVKDITKEQTNFSSNRKNIFSENATDVTQLLFTDSFLGGDEIRLANKTTNIVENNPNFNFMGGARETINSFKQMYSYQDATSEHDFTVNNVFATEFEILTGYRFKISEAPLNILNNTTLGAILYFIGNVVRFAVLEAILSLNKGGFNSRQTFTSSTLKLGTYTINELDIVSKYLIERLNYPYTHQDTISFDKNFISFLIGFNEFISPDSFLDYKIVAQNLEPKGLRDKKGFPVKDGLGLYFAMPLLETFLESFLSAITNTTSRKRYQLLIKKFFQEKYWLKNQLYKHKNKDEFSLFFAEFSSYHFKFLVERVNVGIKIFERYYLDKTYDYTNEEYDHPLTRNSSNRVKANKGSRKKKLKESLGMLPAQSILSTNFIMANVLSGENETKIFSNIDRNLNKIETNHKVVVTNDRRLSSQSVREIEDKLECEYMPFYFHDIRTNEILPFHAFLESISDSFQPDYNASSGYGRIDEVRSYVKTTRSISFSFIIAAMCEEDHDLMWYNINKLVMMVYPQWSGAFTAYDDKGKPKDFKYPFTQVPTASPLVRIRVGDVIKSNYSRSSLARLHGVGNRYTKDGGDLIERNRINEAKEDKSLSKLKLKPDAVVKVSAGVYKTAPVGLFSLPEKHYQNLTIQTIGKVIEVHDNHAIVEVYTPNLAKKLEEVADISVEDTEEARENLRKDALDAALNQAFDAAKSSEEAAFAALDAASEAFSKIIVDKNKLSLVRKSYSDKDPNTGAFKGGEDIDAFMKPTAEGSPASDAQPTTEFKIINPITKAYESGMSRGLAGFITNLTIDYNDMKWETTKIGSKAPMMAKVQVSFAPIHDIPPGLDENGMMRAPIYNTGETMNNMFGDPHDTNKLGNGLDQVRIKIEEYLKN